MAYRNDVDALEARYRALETDLVERTRARDEAARLLADARARAREDAVLADLAIGSPARRRRCHALIVVVIAMVATVAGGVGYRIASRDRIDRVARDLDHFSLFADEMCACSKPACVQLVTEQMNKWAAEMAREQPPVPRFDEATLKRATEISTRMGSCMSKAMTSEAGTNLQQQ